MKILNITSNINNVFSRTNKNNIVFPKFNNLDKDTVSFSSKKYTLEDISSPTMHCAYCGCKVYSEQQLDSLAKEILSAKGDRLQGKIRSVLEKLGDAKNSQEISVAKKIENQSQIDFFKKFLEISSKKTYLKGEEIFLQVYSKQKDDAIKLLTDNLHPLRRTIDHVSPQNEHQGNNNSDMNLVEACYCCNHDLKKGVSFNEFFAIFPSIKNNMPPEKFAYAQSQISSENKNGIFQRFSVPNMLKLVDRLFIQRNETFNALQSIIFRLTECKPQISDLISDLETEISDKNAEIDTLQSTFDDLSKDTEFNAMVRRNALETSLRSESALLSSLQERKSRLSNSINELSNPDGTTAGRRKRKKQAPLSPEKQQENQSKIAELKQSLSEVSAQIEAQDEKVLSVQLDIETLNEQFPTIEMLQFKKKSAEDVYNAHLNYEHLTLELEQKYTHQSSLNDNEKTLREQIAQFPAEPFSIESFSPQEQQAYARYIDLLEAVKFIDEHPNGGNVKNIIKSSAKIHIESELAELEQQPVIVKYKQALKRKDLEAQLAKILQQKENLKHEIERNKQQLEALKSKIALKTKEDAFAESEALASDIKRLNDKQNNLRIPQIVAGLRAEIDLTKQYIESLKNKSAEIDSVLSSET